MLKTIIKIRSLASLRDDKNMSFRAQREILESFIFRGDGISLHERLYILTNRIYIVIELPGIFFAYSGVL